MASRYQAEREARRAEIEAHLLAGGRVKQTYHDSEHPESRSIFPSACYLEPDMHKLAEHIEAREAGFSLPTTFMGKEG